MAAPTQEIARGPYAVLAGDLARQRSARAAAMDLRLEQLFAAALSRHSGAAGRVALVAVGGYGRGELSPYSDIDLVLVHEPSLRTETVASLADSLWYPLWDAGVPLDHSVRDTVSMRDIAATDLRAATGMLDARHVAGETDLSLALRSTVLGDWRRDARARLPALAESCAQRAERSGELAYAAVPDLKDSHGGLRDGAVLRALVATWLVDVPHRAGESHRAALLDVRDALHEVTGRRGDRLHPELVPDVAARLGTTPDELARHVRHLGRRTAHLVQLTWRRVDQVLAGPARRTGAGATRRPPLRRLGDGVAELSGEVVLDQSAQPLDDPWLALRAATLAATEGLVLSPPTAARLAAAAPQLPAPWPEHARRLLVRLLASGPGLVPVWEELDVSGLLDQWLPEWDSVRLRASDPAVHRFTVDRHLVETCVQATRLLPEVARPDLLVVAALLHDIGKGDAQDDSEHRDHSEVGAPVATEIARRWGFDGADADVVGLLVRHHLLLPMTAVRRDIDDPVTLAGVAGVIGDDATLDLLACLTEADARAAAPAAWTRWRAGLVRRLVGALRASLAEGRPVSATGLPLGAPGAVAAPDWVRDLEVDEVRLLVQAQPDGTRVQVASADRPGLLADVAGALATAGLTVRAARAAVHADAAVSTWDVDAPDVDASRLRLRLDRVLDGSVDPGARLAPLDRPVEARVRLLPDVSGTATVLEVRVADRAGLVWRLCRAVTDAGADVRSAHLETLGPQTEDVVYVTDRAGRPLGAQRAEAVRVAVEDAVGGAGAGSAPSGDG